MKQIKKTKRYFGKDHCGIVLFHIDIIIVYDPNSIEVEVSAKHDFYNTPVPKIINMIINEYYNEERRLGLIALLIIAVKGIPDIQFEILNDTADFWEWNGQYNGYEGVLQDILKNADFRDYTPFSTNRNSFIFEKIKTHLTQDKNIFEVLKKEDFEKLVPRNVELAYDYVNFYSNSANYFSIKTTNNEITYRFFIMTIKREVQLIFFREE